MAAVAPVRARRQANNPDRGLVGALVVGLRPGRKGPKQSVWPRMQAAPEQPLCVGDSELFEDPAREQQAIAVCRLCPVSVWCAGEARRARTAGLPIGGVWAGTAYADGKARSTGVRR